MKFDYERVTFVVDFINKPTIGATSDVILGLGRGGWGGCTCLARPFSEGCEKFVPSTFSIVPTGTRSHNCLIAY